MRHKIVISLVVVFCLGVAVGVFAINGISVSKERMKTPLVENLQAQEDYEKYLLLSYKHDEPSKSSTFENFKTYGIKCYDENNEAHEYKIEFGYIAICLDNSKTNEELTLLSDSLVENIAEIFSNSSFENISQPNGFYTLLTDSKKYVDANTPENVSFSFDITEVESDNYFEIVEGAQRVALGTVDYDLIRKELENRLWDEN